MAKSSDRKQQISRSVDCLSRLFSVVVGLAVCVAVQQTIFDSSGHMLRWYDVSAKNYPLLQSAAIRVPLLLAFIVTIVPFYHGMNCHLDRTYVEQTADRPKQGFLIFDFFVFFLESCLLLALASLLSDGISFLVVLCVLLVVDIAWGVVAYGVHSDGVMPGLAQWVGINMAAVAALVAFALWSPRPEWITWWSLFIAVFRTIADYKFCWRYYFPSE